MSVLDPVVQEASVQSYSFTISSDIPGAKVGGVSSDMMSAVHIFFPQVITKDPKNAGSDVIDIFVNGDKSPISGAPLYSVDTSLTYNEFCQIYLCYLITFVNDDIIKANSKLKVDVKNLINPESILTVGDIEATTLMKYTADTIYYVIDSKKGPSNFNAKAGTIDATTMKVSHDSSNTKATYADN